MHIFSKLLKEKNLQKRIPLDNAAKFFPGTSSYDDTSVFRITCEITEKVDPSVLQNATENALKQYPIYACVLHKGLFWYSLEESEQKPIVHEDCSPPCCTLYNRKQKSLQFSVTYKNNRISLEVFHVLSDGGGALRFFELLVANYIAYKHPECTPALISMKDKLLSEYDSNDDFNTYYSGESIQKALKYQEKAHRGHLLKKRGYRLVGAREPNFKTKLMVGMANSDAVLSKAREYGVSVTVFLTAALMLAIQSTTPTKKKHSPIIIVSIPVNLRKYFSSNSVRNFFQVINVKHNFNKKTDSFHELTNKISEQFAFSLTPERLSARINTLCSFEHNPLLRIIPRQGKDIMLRLASIFGQIQTTSISNLGKIVMPLEMNKYINLFEFTTSTPRMQLNICSYEKKMVMNIASRLVKTEIQEAFFEILSNLGIKTDMIAE